MDQWRSYFAKSGADIWTVIDQAIILAATDFPVNFKEKRSDIAETLFSKKLLQLCTSDVGLQAPSRLMVTDAVQLREESKRKQNHEVPKQIRRVEGEGCCSYEALTHHVEEESHWLKDLNSIKEIIADCNQSENRIYDALQKLEYMHISVEALKETEIGKHVNGLRKHSSKRVRGLVKQLVRNWRGMVDEWAQRAEDVTSGALKGAVGGKVSETEAGHLEFALPPLDECALMSARTPPLEISQLNFLDDKLCSQPLGTDDLCNGAHLSVTDNLQNSSKSFSGSILTDCSDHDAKAITSRSSAPEERCKNRQSNFTWNVMERRGTMPVVRNCAYDSSQLNEDNGLSLSKTTTVGSGPGRPSTDVPRTKVISGRTIVEISRRNRSLKPSFANKATLIGKSQAENIEEKLDSSKRKLSDGFQQAQDVKRQHTAQAFDLPNIPKAALVGGKMNPPAQQIKTVL